MKKVKRCKYKDCVGVYYAKGYCNTHYSRMIRKGTTVIVRAGEAECSEDGCCLPTRSKGLCTNHYQNKQYKIRIER